MNDVMIKIDSVSKIYTLGQIGGTSLRDELQRRKAKRKGLDDPTKKIGSKTYQVGEKFKALDNISFEVKRGERIGIIGHNGAGKSTLLKLLSRVTAPTSGEIGLNGRIASMLEVGTGFHPELTGRENIYMNGAILGMTKSEIDRKMEDIIEFSECRQFIDTPVKRYSSGMYVKLAFSVAAHLDSEIMIMDEVLAVGDMTFQKKCMEKMKNVSEQENRTILYVSHNMNTVRQLCEKCVVLDHGTVAFIGDVEKAISIYLGISTSQRLYYDCDTLPREKIVDGGIHMRSVELLELTEPTIDYSGDFTIRIVYRANKHYDNLMFRMIVFSEQGTPVGMTASKDSIHAINGENRVDLRFHLGSLATGLYRGRVVMYEVNEYGAEILHDVVHDAVTFFKDNSKSYTNTTIAWKQNVWGNIEFPETEVIKCENGSC
ncbi:MAG: polysaccharide ABC transporter ATP-binding protein [bacterium]|nr:polysaccharide ABC transporter ATP-binding protein [bacterium]